MCVFIQKAKRLGQTFKAKCQCYIIISNLVYHIYKTLCYQLPLHLALHLNTQLFPMHEHDCSKKFCISFVDAKRELLGPNGFLSVQKVSTHAHDCSKKFCISFVDAKRELLGPNGFLSVQKVSTVNTTTWCLLIFLCMITVTFQENS